jgi:hypothetical protein
MLIADIWRAFVEFFRDDSDDDSDDDDMRDEVCRFCGYRGKNVCDTPPPDLCERAIGQRLPKPP